MAVYTIDTSPKPKPSPKKSSSSASRRRLVASIGGSVILLGAGLTAWALWPASVPAVDADPVVLVKFAASDQFAEMSQEQKQPYIDRLMRLGMPELFRAAGEANLSPEQRMRGMENFMMARWGKTIDEYFALAPGQQRDAYLDKMIDTMAQRRSQWQNLRPRGNQQRPEGQRGNWRGGGGRGRQITAEQQKRRNETIPPERRAQMTELMAAMRERREQRGTN